MELVLGAAPRRDGGYEGWIEYGGPSPVRFLIWRDGESLGAVPFVRDRQAARFVYPKPGKYTVTVDLPDGSTARSNEVEIRADVVPAAGFAFFDPASRLPWWRTHRTALLVIGAILLLVILYFTFVFRAEWIDRSGLTHSTWSMRRAIPDVPAPMIMTPVAACDVSAAYGTTASAITGPHLRVPSCGTPGHA